MSRCPDDSGIEHHEVRRTLGLIRGYVHLARRGAAAGTLDTDAMIRCLDIALEQVDLISDRVDGPNAECPRSDGEDRVLGDIGLIRNDMYRY